MESLTLLRKYFALFGINLQRSPQNLHRFNLRNLTVILFASLGGISINKLTSEATTFEEYTDLVYRTIYVYIFVVLYTYTVWKTEDLSRIVYTLEDSIDKSK